MRLQRAFFFVLLVVLLSVGIAANSSVLSNSTEPIEVNTSDIDIDLLNDSEIDSSQQEPLIEPIIEPIIEPPTEPINKTEEETSTDPTVELEPSGEEQSPIEQVKEPKNPKRQKTVPFNTQTNPDDEYETLIVHLKDRPILKPGQRRLGLASGPTTKKQMIVQSQNEFLGDLSIDDYTINHKFAATNAITITVKKSEAHKIRNNPDVVGITENRRIHLSLQNSFPLINGTDAHNFTKGGIRVDGINTTVCVIDTGVNNTHPALAGRVVAEQCFCETGNFGDSAGCCINNLNSESGDATDENGHGTHVTGIVAGGNGVLHGIAENASIVSVKIFSKDRTGYLSDMIAGIDWCVANAQSYNITVITLSLGTGELFTNASKCEANYSVTTASIDEAVSRGIMVTIASGNGGSSTGISSPACIYNATSVGNTNDADNGFVGSSNRGVLLDIVAPGQTINSSVPANCPAGGIGQSCAGSGYSTLTGTSQATPHVAGAVLLLQQWSRLNGGPDMSPLDVRYLLTKFTTKMIDGYPRLDLTTALNAIYFINTASGRVQAPRGVVIFDGVNDFSHTNFCVNISDNLISVNSSDSRCTQYNTAASVTLTNVPYATTPIILEGDRLCSFPECNITGFSSGNLSFRVSHFSNYTSGENSNLSIYDNNDTEGGSFRIYANMTLGLFIANYTNRTSGENAIGWCNITITEMTPVHATMDFDDSRLVYNYSFNFSNSGTFEWNVTCNSSTYENLSAGDTIDVVVFTRPNITVSKTDAQDPVNQSVIYNYSINVTNVGDATAYDVTVFETYDGNFTFIGADPVANMSNDTWVIHSIGMGTSYIINVSVQITGFVSNATNVTNKVSIINYTDDINSVYSDAVNDTENTLVFILPSLQPNVIISKVDSQDPVNRSDTFNYSINVSNIGNGTAYNISILEFYDTNLTFIGADPAPNSSNDSWTIFSLGIDSSYIINITVNVTGKTINNANITNTVNITNFTNSTNFVFTEDRSATQDTLIVFSNHEPKFNTSNPIQDITMGEDSINTTINLTHHFFDSDGDVLRFGFNKSSIIANVTISVNFTSGIVTINASNNFTGVITAIFNASDQNATTLSNNITITITPVNDPPTFNGSNLIPNITATEDSLNDSINLSEHFYDVEGDAINFSVVHGDNLTVVINSRTGILNITPDGNFTGFVVLTITANDTSGKIATSNEFKIDVMGINDAPSLQVVPNQSIIEEGSGSINLNNYSYDVDGDSIDFSVTAQNTGQVACSVIGSNLTFTGMVDFNGTANCTIIASDSLLNSTPITLFIDVTNVNDLPIANISNPPNQSTIENKTQVNFTGSGTDVEDGTIPSVSVGWISSIDGFLGIGTSFNTTNLSVGNHTITLQANDSDGAFGSDTLEVEISLAGSGTNFAPSVMILGPANGTIFNNETQINFTGLANDTEDGVLTGSSIVWRSSIDGYIGIGNLTNTSNLSVGTHTILMIASDSAGKNNSDTITIIIEAPLDTDADMVPNINDPFEGNSNNITVIGELTNLALAINGNTSVDGQKPVGIGVVSILNGSTVLVNLTFNFTMGTFNTSRVTIFTNGSGIAVNLDGQLQAGHNKTIVMVNHAFTSLCARNAPTTSITEISDSCLGANEVDLTDCLGNASVTSRSGIQCQDTGVTIIVSNLTYSGVRGGGGNFVNEESTPPGGSSGGGGGGGSGGGRGGGSYADQNPATQIITPAQGQSVFAGSPPSFTLPTSGPIERQLTPGSAANDPSPPAANPDGSSIAIPTGSVVQEVGEGQPGPAWFKLAIFLAVFIGTGVFLATKSGWKPGEMIQSWWGRRKAHRRVKKKVDEYLRKN